MNIAGSLFALSQFENIKKVEKEVEKVDEEKKKEEKEKKIDTEKADSEKKKEEKPAVTKKKNTNCIGEKQNEVRKKIRKVEKSDV